MDGYTINKIEDYGAALYEKSNAKSIYDAPTGKVGAKGWAQRIYMLVLGAGLLGWFLYSLITSASEQGFGDTFVGHLLALFVLILSEVILLLTAFGGWGKFSRAVLRHNALKRKHRIEGVRTRALEEEIKTADANKANECALRIYRDYVVVINNGEKTALLISELQKVQCDACPQGYQLTFISYDGTEVIAKALLPVYDLPIVKKYFVCFEYTPVDRGKGYLRKKFPLLAFMFIPVFIGIALILLHCLVIPDMPIVFGILFLSLGVLLVIAQFSDFAVVRHGIMPIGGGIILMAMPLGVLLTLADLLERSLTTFLTPFTAIHAVLGLFLGFGPMLIILGIAGIVDCLKLK